MHSIRRLLNTITAGLLILGSPGPLLVEVVEHSKSFQQAAHPNGAHYEGKGSWSHTDHCVASRVMGDDRLIRDVETPRSFSDFESGPSAQLAPVGPALPLTDTNRSRAPPPAGR